MAERGCRILIIVQGATSLKRAGLIRRVTCVLALLVIIPLGGVQAREELKPPPVSLPPAPPTPAAVSVVKSVAQHQGWPGRKSPPHRLQCRDLALCRELYLIGPVPSFRESV